MKTNALIWRKTMYDNGFKCNVCGTPCAAADGTPSASVLTDGEHLFCGACKNYIAIIKQVDVNENEVPDDRKMGYFGDFEKKKMN